MKLNYIENVIPTQATVAFNTTSYRMNSCYNPRVAGGGHQPYYFDQMMAVYNHYTVIGAKATVVVTNTGTVPVCFGGYLNDDSTVGPTSLLNCQETVKSHWKLIPPNSQQSVKLNWKWSAAKWFTKSKSSLLADVNLTGTSSADPGEATVLTLFWQSIDGATTTGITFTLRMEFVTVFTELKDIQSS